MSDKDHTVACRNCKYSCQDPIDIIGYKLTDEVKCTYTYYFFYKDICATYGIGPEPTSMPPLYIVKHTTYEEAHILKEGWDPELVEEITNYPEHECHRYPPEPHNSKIIIPTVTPAWSCGEYKPKKGRFWSRQAYRIKCATLYKFYKWRRSKRFNKK